MDCRKNRITKEIMTGVFNQEPSKYGASVFSANYFLSVSISKKICLSFVLERLNPFLKFPLQASPQRTTKYSKDSFYIVMPTLSIFISKSAY